MAGIVERLQALSWAELRFRLASGARTWRDRAAAAATPPRWQRRRLTLAQNRSAGSPALERARVGLAERPPEGSPAWRRIHRDLAAHFASRRSVFPLPAAESRDRFNAIRTHFPGAPGEARARADRIVSGAYDLLGYSALRFGSPPDWHLDPVHGRRAPMRFWSQVPYLDPASGDHKVIWELNRHQHWLALGRAWHLTRDARYYTAFVQQLGDWLDRNPPLMGANWASMLELSFRSISWLWAIELFADAASHDGDASPPWTVDLLVGIERQLAHVLQNLSEYFSPNTHLTGEALALYVAGLALPELPGSRVWAQEGRRVLLEQIDRQVLEDGGHAELSAHYHRYSTDFYLLALLVARKADDPAAARLEQAARRQARFLRSLADDDGRLPLLGDDDGGLLLPVCGRMPADARDTLATAAILLEDPRLAVSDAPEESFWLCGPRAAQLVPARVPWPSGALSASGYYVARDDSGDHLIFDAGRHGYLNGGHAHADALSVVLTAAGHPFIVDPGTATYTMDPAARDRFRSPAMHNTLVVGGRAHSVPRGPFHWDRRTDARAPMWHSASGVDYGEGTHDGYRPVVHTRAILAAHGTAWIILDHVLGDGPASVATFFHLDPGWLHVRNAPTACEAVAGDGMPAAVASSIDLSIVLPADTSGLSDVAPVYGRIVHSHTLHGTSEGHLPMTIATVITAGAGRPQVRRVAPLEPEVWPGAGWHASAFEIEFAHGKATLLAAIETTGAADAARAAPGRLWGTRDVQTDGRVALAFSDPRPSAVMVNGTRLTWVDGEVVLPAAEPVVRLSPAAAGLRDA